MTAQGLIAAEGLGKSFGAHRVLKGINLAINEGEVVCVIGPSGSGKTTLLRCMALLEQPVDRRHRPPQLLGRRLATRPHRLDQGLPHRPTRVREHQTTRIVRHGQNIGSALKL